MLVIDLVTILKLVSIGAEAKISIDDNIIIKERIIKGYREPALDRKIRRARTKRESNLLVKAGRAGVLVPKVIETTEFILKMENISGKRVKDMLNKKNMKTVCADIGQSVAKLHNADIIHGDLTTSNMMLKDDKVYFIDFGLGFISSKAEDKATDIHLLEEAIESTHFKFACEAMDIFFKAYKKHCVDGASVISRLNMIRLRGRYNIREAEIK